MHVQFLLFQLCQSSSLCHTSLSLSPLTLLAIMQGQVAPAPNFKQQAVAYLNSISDFDFEVFSCYTVPPTLAGKVMLAVLHILAGRHPDIVVDQQLKPINVEWPICRKMMQEDPVYLIDICRSVSELVGRDQRLDSALQEHGQQLLSSGEITPDLANLHANAAVGFCGWIFCLLEHKRQIYAQVQEQISAKG